jgi:hypothetical protein
MIIRKIIIVIDPRGYTDGFIYQTLVDHLKYRDMLLTNRSFLFLILNSYKRDNYIKLLHVRISQVA